MPSRPAISSHSLGRAWVHDLPARLDQAALYGLDIELMYEDLVHVAKALPGGLTAPNQLAAANIIRSLCDQRGIAIVCLQPFMHYEGLKDRARHTEKLEEITLWFQLAKILGTDLIAIPSTSLPADEVTGELDTIVADFVEIADMGAAENIRFTYESLCWGTCVDMWEKCWEIVTLVDRPNFGICLDTFNLAGRVYADPAAASGKTPNAEADIEASIKRLVDQVDAKKIFYIQVVDAERLQQPLVQGHDFYDASQPARMSWSRNCRLFYQEKERGAYLPIKAILEAVFTGLGFEGYVSMELFNRSMSDPDTSVPAEHARRAAEAWRRMVQDFGLKTERNVERSLRPQTSSMERAQL